MEWGAFFAGAVAMLFTMALGVWLLPVRKQQQDREHWQELSENWEEANRLSAVRNNLLAKIEGCLHDLSAQLPER